MSELLPCPFCGGEAKLDKGLGHHFAVCAECDVYRVPSMENNTPEAAVAAWNTRAQRTPDACAGANDDRLARRALEDEVKRLRDALKEAAHQLACIAEVEDCASPADEDGPEWIYREDVGDHIGNQGCIHCGAKLAAYHARAAARTRDAGAAQAAGATGPHAVEARGYDDGRDAERADVVGWLDAVAKERLLVFTGTPREMVAALRDSIAAGSHIGAATRGE